MASPVSLCIHRHMAARLTGANATRAVRYWIASSTFPFFPMIRPASGTLDLDADLVGRTFAVVGRNVHLGTIDIFCTSVQTKPRAEAPDHRASIVDPRRQPHAPSKPEYIARGRPSIDGLFIRGHSFIGCTVDCRSSDTSVSLSWRSGPSRILALALGGRTLRRASTLFAGAFGVGANFSRAAVG